MTNDGTEKFKYVGPVKELTASEHTLVSAYLNASHRTNMNIIDNLGGDQNYIWKEVDQYGNERY